MEGFSSTNSLSTLLCPVDEEMKQRNCVYSSEFQAMLDGLDNEDSTNAEEEGQIADKKRRLSYNQVKALERIFEVNNKLDPGRKVALAKELGLQPRQVAIWFQNRRARWKIKQLEMDYNKLKASYESLKLNYGELEQNKGNLTNELQELKAKIGHKNVDNNMSTFRSQSTASRYRRALSEPESSNIVTNLLDSKVLSDSDSSGVLNEETNHTYQLPTPNQDLSNPGLDFYPLSEMNNYKMFPDSRNVSTNAYQQQWMKVEDGCVFGDVDESNFFSVDQVPSFW